MRPNDQEPKAYGVLNALLVVTGGLVAFFILQVFYNLYLHPLSGVPGPFSWAASRLPFIRALLKGTIVHDFQRLHLQYGPVLRVAPNEVTFAHEKAWEDIFHPRSDGQQLLKDSIWWGRQEGLPPSIINAIDPEEHAYIRKTLAPAFTSRALRSQEPVIIKYVQLLVQQLQSVVKNSTGNEDGHADIDMTQWFHFLTFDIFGDLGFGESFDCLQTSKYHPWIALLFNSVKAASVLAAVRYYPPLRLLLDKCIPRSMKKMKARHYQQIVDKVDRRLNWELDRPDIMSHAIGGGKDASEGLPLGIIYATFGVLTTAGSETTATVLSGIVNYLVKNRDELQILTKEIRQNLQSHDEITLAGTAVSIQTYTMNRRQDYFHDALSFIPERWLPEATSNPKSPFFNDRRQAIQAFSTGPRNCLGKDLAWAEMRLTLCMILRYFDLEAVPGSQVDWEDLRTFLLVEKKPIMVRLRSVADR